MPFMEKQIIESGYVECETSEGTEIVPLDLVGGDPSIDSLADFVSGEISEFTVHEKGFLSRLSAPGYMDCTEWSAHETEKEAEESLAEMYDDD